MNSFRFVVNVFVLIQRKLPVRIDRNAVAAQQRTAQDAIVAAAIALVDGDHDQTAFGGLNVLHRTVFDFLAAKQSGKKNEKH